MVRMEREGKSKEEIDEAVNHACDSYREVFLREEVIIFLKDMINRGWIKE